MAARTLARTQFPGRTHAALITHFIRVRSFFRSAFSRPAEFVFVSASEFLPPVRYLYLHLICICICICISIRDCSHVLPLQWLSCWLIWDYRACTLRKKRSSFKLGEEIVTIKNVLKQIIKFLH